MNQTWTKLLPDIPELSNEVVEYLNQFNDKVYFEEHNNRLFADLTI